MALLSRLELAEKFNVPTNQLAVMISRASKGKKILMDGDYVNDTNPMNKAWIDKYQQKAIAKGGKKTERREKETGSDESEENNSYALLEKEKLKEQVEKLKNENRKLKLNNEKTVGNFIPVDHANVLILQLSEAIHLSWESELHDVLSKLSSRFQLTRDEITEIKKEKTSASNSARQRSIKEAKKLLRKLQNDTSDKRGVGEHD